MPAEIVLCTVCVPSWDVVSREVEGEIVIVPLAPGIGDADDELCTLNETGHEMWRRLDGQAVLGQIAVAPAEEFGAPFEVTRADVLFSAREMARRRILEPGTRAGGR